MNQQLNIESNPLDELIGINLEPQSEIDLTYLEQFASNTFSQLTDQLISSSTEDSVTIYEDKSEYRTEVENGPISNLLEANYQTPSPTSENMSPTQYSSPTSQYSSSTTSFVSPNPQYLSPTSDYSSPTCQLPSPPPLTPSPTLDSPIYQTQTPNQVFFPVGFNPNHFHYQTPVCHQPYHQRYQNPQEWSPADCNSFQLLHSSSNFFGI